VRDVNGDSIKKTDRILMAHGAGGVLSRELVEQVFLPELGNPALNPLDDSAVLRGGAFDLAFTTDSYVVQPLFFPGGDIGRLAVCGTVNDLAAVGAMPLALSLGLVLEEGLELAPLRRIVRSIRQAAEEAGVRIVTGDTKVVERGKADGLFINTSGLGKVRRGRKIFSRLARPGDAVLVSGRLGDHGIAVLSEREGFAFETKVRSDVAPLNGLVKRVLAATKSVHCLRDPTRGGLAAVLNEIARASKVGIRIEEKSIPILPAVRGACELFGFDPLTIPSEGKMVVICAARSARRVLQAMRRDPYGRRAAIIGEVIRDDPGRVTLTTGIGGGRIVDMPYGELLPRIC